jgi:hypothetical protein
LSGRDPLSDFTRAGDIQVRLMDLHPAPLPVGRVRHKYGEGPFAKLAMPPLPELPGLYLWVLDENVVYVGQTRVPLRERLGPKGYASISNYNTFAREPGRKNGGQQTNCRINALANQELSQGHKLSVWYRSVGVGDPKAEEADWMREFGLPLWNRRDER